MGRPVIGRLHFENWRSLRNVTIDNLTPITVFVGANSSGKTNIIDALDFLRVSYDEGLLPAISRWEGQHAIRYIHAQQTDAVQIDVDYQIRGLEGLVKSSVRMQFLDKSEDFPVRYRRQLDEGADNLINFEYDLPLHKVRGEVGKEEFNRKLVRSNDVAGVLSTFLKRRIQTISADFLAPERGNSNHDPYMIDKQGTNLPAMLAYMQRFSPEVYETLQADAKYLLGHIESVKTRYTGTDIEMLLIESALGGQRAPTISTGTRHLLGILAAYHALDMPSTTLPEARPQNVPDMGSPDAPGVLIIEEPDTAIHPLLLGKLVDLLRAYVDRPEPRQFILTTHNPMLLNYFEPAEVRIVERDAQGETVVRGVDMGVAEAWFEQDGAYNLGDIWTTRLLGGVPE